MSPLPVNRPPGPLVQPSTVGRTAAVSATAPAAVAATAPTTGTDSFRAAGPGSTVFPQGAHRRGAWAWQTAGITSPVVLDALVNSQKSAGATELYFNAYPALGREAFLADALGRTAAAGLKPQLLLGSPDWAAPSTRPWLRDAIVAPLRAVRAAVPLATAEKLTVHLDVEPHATGPLTPERMRDYLGMLDWVRDQLGDGFALQVDIPVWYQGQQVDGRDFAEEILKRTDGVTLMAYERPVDQVVRDVAPTLATAARLGKEALVAVELGPAYAGVGLGRQSDVKRFLVQLDTGLAGTPGYGGCALHGLEELAHLPL